MNAAQKEFEVRFLEIDVPTVKKKLIELGAQDKGEVLLRETILYNEELGWRDQNKLLRVREDSRGVEVTYKHQPKVVTMGSLEIEFRADSAQRAVDLFEAIGLTAFRRQEKKRHTFALNGCVLDIDTWPKVPAYLEIEGAAEEEIKAVALSLGFSWGDAVFENPRAVLKLKYGIPMSDLRYFTFDHIE